MKKKRLLIFHPTIAPYRIDLFNALYAAFETRICLQYENLKSQKFDYDKISSRFTYNPIYLPETSKLSLCKNVWNHIREYEPDVVLTCEFGLVTLSSLFTKIWLKKKIRLVVMTDDSYDMVAEGHDFTTRHRKARELIVPLVEDVIVVSPVVQAWYKKQYGKGIWMPIIVKDENAVSNYACLLPKSRHISDKYRLSDKKVLLSVSRLVDLKNLHRVIDAFALCQTEAVLVIVGDGPERESLQEHARKVGKEIIFTGRLDGDELYVWYNIASVFILASYKEPFGAVTNEALLAGCRVVISDKAGSSCLVSEDNGETINPLNVMMITEAIDRQLAMAEIPNFNTIRTNMMLYSFNERMQNLIESIDNL